MTAPSSRQRGHRMKTNCVKTKIKTWSRAEKYYLKKRDFDFKFDIPHRHLLRNVGKHYNNKWCQMSEYSNLRLEEYWSECMNKGWDCDSSKN
jgi:hypothetical protein